ncbi:MAG: PIN domain-containing protein [Conexivisphaera sp.]
MDQGGQGQDVVGARERERPCYIDSCVIISLALHDEKYQAARSLVEKSQAALTSAWGIVEVAATLHRRLKEEDALRWLRLPGDVRRLLKRGGPSFLVDYLLEYVIRDANVSILDEDPESAQLRIGNLTVRSPAVYRDAVDLAPKLKLSTGDLLHIAYARRASAACFATLDKDIVRRRSEIEEYTGISVLEGS